MLVTLFPIVTFDRFVAPLNILFGILPDIVSVFDNPLNASAPIEVMEFDNIVIIDKDGQP